MRRADAEGEGHSDTLARRLRCTCLPSAYTVLRTVVQMYTVPVHRRWVLCRWLSQMQSHLLGLPNHFLIVKSRCRHSDASIRCGRRETANCERQAVHYVIMGWRCIECAYRCTLFCLGTISMHLLGLIRIQRSGDGRLSYEPQLILVCPLLISGWASLCRGQSGAD
jgi:hypothetical protein